MIIKEIIKSAESILKTKKVRDVVIGLELMAIELDDNSIGLSYVLTDRLQGKCKTLPETGKLKGISAFQLAMWALNRENDIRSGLGIAVLNSVSHHFYDSNTVDQIDAAKVFAFKKTDTVGFVGLIAPIVNRIKPQVKEVIVFDKGKEGFQEGIYPWKKQSEILPKCDIIYISGSTLINHSIDELLHYCHSVRQVIVTGLSTCLYPEAFCKTPVTYLAGMSWNPENKILLFNKISQAGGMIHIAHLGKKIMIKIK